jgi:UDP-3-O-[3-hydroxymyristoyl] glucosamine N-acyltransferase
MRGVATAFVGSTFTASHVESDASGYHSPVSPASVALLSQVLRIPASPPQSPVFGVETTKTARSSVPAAQVGAHVGVYVAVGVGVGVFVGATVGVSVGASVGASVGVSVGTSVAVSVGASVAVSVGASVGVELTGNVQLEWFGSEGLQLSRAPLSVQPGGSAYGSANSQMKFALPSSQM